MKHTTYKNSKKKIYKYKALFTNSAFNKQEIDSLNSSGIDFIAAPENLSEKELIKSLKDIDIYIMGGSDKATKTVLEKTNIKLIIFYGTGYKDFIDVETAQKLGIPITNTPKANAYTVAEHTIALILDVVKGISNLNNEVKSGTWKTNEVWNLKDKTLGIIGMGTIGQNVARIMKNGFQMDICYYGPNEKSDIAKELDIKRAHFDELLKKSDIISLHLPLTSKTKNIIGEYELGLMKKQCVLINTSRAELINPQALTKALKSNKIKSAAFDSYYDEPMTPKNDQYGLLNMPDNKFIITPHTAFKSKEASEDANKMVIENIEEWVKEN